jgi:dolichol kinase
MPPYNIGVWKESLKKKIECVQITHEHEAIVPLNDNGFCQGLFHKVICLCWWFNSSMFSIVWFVKIDTNKEKIKWNQHIVLFPT